MRHYEIVALVHPDQSNQTDKIVGRYRDTIERGGGIVHRYENWGRRRLAYPINKLYKAGYFLLNIECAPSVKDELENLFRFNDSILRTLVLRMDRAVTEDSPIMKKLLEQEAEEQSRREAENRERAERAKREAAAQAEKDAASRKQERDAASAKADSQASQPAESSAADSTKSEDESKPDNED